MSNEAPSRFDFDLTEPDPIPGEGIARALELLRSGRLFRYTEVGDGEVNDTALLETRFAELVGRRYAVCVNSCGSALFLALRASGVQPYDKVLMNGYTLAPVPGAIQHAGAEAVLVEIDERLTIDVDDLRKKAQQSGATTLLLSHMRGHLADLDKVSAVCDAMGIDLIEDCAHTLGASWGGQPTGTFGRVGCFSTQTFKHMNSGEGGVLVTDDPQIAARAILHSGSYMFYGQHEARPPMSTFESLRGVVPNYSLRMSALAAAVARRQLDLLAERASKMNALYRELEKLVMDIPHARVVERAPQEDYVGSSFQFSLPELSPDQISVVVGTANGMGLHVKWYGEPLMQGFTSRPHQWDYVAGSTGLPRTEAILAKLCELRVPPAMDASHCRLAADILLHAISVAVGTS